MKAYKGFKKTSDGKLVCRDFTYEEGKTYTMPEEDVELCCSGFHASPELLKCLFSYPYIKGETEYHKVECSGKIISNDERGILVCSTITIGEKVEMPFANNLDGTECYYHSNETMFAVKNEKFRPIKPDGTPLTDDWYERIYSPVCKDDFIIVVKNDKYNYIKADGKPLCDEWYDCCLRFRNNLGMVKRNKQYNFVKADGTLLSDIWFDFCSDYQEDLCIVEKDGKFNYLKTDGTLLIEEWYDYCYNSVEGYGIVNKDGKSNYIQPDGRLLSKEWFKCCDPFIRGKATVVKDNARYTIDTNGVLSKR